MVSWKVIDDKIVQYWVMVDFPYVMQHLGVDPFDRHGWDRRDSSRQPVLAGD